jgi:hypothetical protein
MCHDTGPAGGQPAGRSGSDDEGCDMNEDTSGRHARGGCGSWRQYGGKDGRR